MDPASPPQPSSPHRDPAGPAAGPPDAPAALLAGAAARAEAPSPALVDTLPHRLRRWLPLDRLLLALLLLAGTWTYFSVPNYNGNIGGVAELDGYYYYIYLRSLQMDGDIDFANEYEQWGNPFKFGTTATGHTRNIFGVGPALLWAPFFLLTHLLALLLVKLGVPLWLDGISRFHQVGTFYGSLLMGWLAVVFSYRLVRRVIGREGTIWAVLGVALAGPLPFYCLTLASFSHAQAAMAASLLVWAWVSWREEGWTTRRWCAVGGALGLLVLVRPACFPFALLPLYEGARTVIAPYRAGERGRALLRRAAGPLAGAAVALLVFAPQLVTWRLLFGHWVLVPQGQGFMRWGESAWASTLFSPRNGLFTTAPLMALALVGLFVQLRRRAALVGPLLLVVAALLLVNGAVHDWWGWGFSTRRVTALLPIFALGLAFALGALRRLLQRSPRRAALVLSGLLVAGFVLFNLQWMFNHSIRFMTWTNLGSSQAMYMTVTHRLVDGMYKRVGNPMSLPASLAFTLRRGGSPQIYDKVDGHYLVGEEHRQANPGSRQDKHSTMILADPKHRFHLGEGFGFGRVEQRVHFVPLRRPRGHIFLPINRPGDITIFIGGRARYPGTALELRFNGTKVHQQALPGTAWSMVQARVPAELVDRGINRLDLWHHLPEGWDAPDSRRIGGTGVTSPVDIGVVSGGIAWGRFAEIWLGEQKVSENLRGLNVAVIDGKSGRLLHQRGLDAYLRPAMFGELGRYLRTFPRGSIVALAVRDRVGRNYGLTARAALALFGAQTDLSQAPDAGYAALGVLGAAPGTALEQTAKVGHARVHVGRPPPPWREVAHYRVLQVK